MSKKAKLAIFIPLALVVAIGIIAAAMAGSATRAYDKVEPTTFCRNGWDISMTARV